MDLAAAERFYVDGLGLIVLFRKSGNKSEADLLMVGPEDGLWHLELTMGGDSPIEPNPTSEDLLVVYLGAVELDEIVAQAVACGGVIVAAHNPYWDEGGVTIVDPDGYSTVLTQRLWGPNIPSPKSP